MSQQVFPAKPHIEIILLVLEGFQVLFLWLHDWIPLGRLNNVTAVRSQGTLLPLVAVALVQSAPFTFALLFSLLLFGQPYPHWLYMGLSISYGLIFVGQIRAWWIPYLFHSETGRAAGYRPMFSKCSATHTTSCPFVRACPEHRARHARFGNRSHAVHSSRALKTGSPARVVDAAADPETSALSRPHLAVRFCGYHTPALFGDGPVLLSANHQNADCGTR